MIDVTDPTTYVIVSDLTARVALAVLLRTDDGRSVHEAAAIEELSGALEELKTGVTR